MNEFIVIIPSRLSSTRLKEKALLDLNGKSLIERVYLRAIQSNAKEVFIATDSKKIEDHVKKFSPNVILTSKEHESGTDRVHECDEKLDEIITDDNKGLIPDLINEIKQDGSKVVILGYYSVPEGSEFEDLVLEIEILNDRYKEFAEINDDVYFISLKDIMSPEETPDYYSDDLVHPSEEGHQAIGNHIADFITNSG